MTLTLEMLQETAIADPHRVFNSIGHCVGIDSHYKFKPAKWIDQAKRPHYRFAESDKAAQRTVLELLKAVYEPVFTQLEISHGYRIAHNVETAHESLQLTAKNHFCIIKTDIKNCFESIPHHHLNRFLDRRVRCGRVRKFINNFLRVKRLYSPSKMNPGVKTEPYCGDGVLTGSVLGPMLCNVFLHYVLDEWFAETFPDFALIRYADDFVMVMPEESAGFAGVMVGRISERLWDHGLTLNTLKTDVKIMNRGEALKFLGMYIH